MTYATKLLQSESVKVYYCLRSSSVHIDKVLAWLRFRKVYALGAGFIKTYLRITNIHFLPTISEPNRF